MTTQKELKRIKAKFNNLHDVEWIETANMVNGFKMKIESLTNTKLIMADEIGYKLRHASPYTIDQNYLIALFEPKELT
jgi:hypothetical protein